MTAIRGEWKSCHMLCRLHMKWEWAWDGDGDDDDDCRYLNLQLGRNPQISGHVSTFYR